MYLGVKFYAADPCKLVEEITRYQFFLQVKLDILQGRLPVSQELSVDLAALALQCKFINEYHLLVSNEQDLYLNLVYARYKSNEIRFKIIFLYQMKKLSLHLVVYKIRYPSLMLKALRSRIPTIDNDRRKTNPNLSQL